MVRSRVRDIAADRQRPGAAGDESGQAGQIQQIGFVSGRPEHGAGRGDGDQLDRAEAVRQMDREYGHQQHGRDGHADERHERAEKNGHAAEHLDQDRERGHEMGRGNDDGVQDAGEHIGTFHELGVSVREEAISDDQAERDGCTAGDIPASR